jgi:hypothetical protein
LLVADLELGFQSLLVRPADVRRGPEVLGSGFAAAQKWRIMVLLFSQDVSWVDNIPFADFTAT